MRASIGPSKPAGDFLLSLFRTPSGRGGLPTVPFCKNLARGDFLLSPFCKNLLAGDFLLSPLLQKLCSRGTSYCPPFAKILLAGDFLLSPLLQKLCSRGTSYCPWGPSSADGSDAWLQFRGQRGHVHAAAGVIGQHERGFIQGLGNLAQLAVHGHAAAVGLGRGGQLGA
jgi:hypothetical protein